MLLVGGVRVLGDTVRLVLVGVILRLCVDWEVGGGFVEESKLVLVMSKSVKSNSLLGVSKSMLESMVSRGLG